MMQDRKSASRRQIVIPILLAMVTLAACTLLPVVEPTVEPVPVATQVTQSIQPISESDASMDDVAIDGDVMDAVDDDAPITELADFTQYQYALNGKATAYVCRNYVCEFPTTEIETMMGLIEKAQFK